MAVSPARPRAVPDDLLLAERCVSGDELAQREFFRREVRHVHATLYRVLGSNTEIEDLVQEAFFQIFRSMGSFRGDASLSTWLDRITVRVAYAHLSRRRVPTTQLELVPEPRSPQASAEDRVVARDAARRLYAILDELEARKRIAFTLHVVDGRPLKQVAQQMESSLVLAKVRVWRAMQFVKERARQDPALARFLDLGRGGAP